MWTIYREFYRTFKTFCSNKKKVSESPSTLRNKIFDPAHYNDVMIFSSLIITIQKMQSSSQMFQQQEHYRAAELLSLNSILSPYCMYGANISVLVILADVYAYFYLPKAVRPTICRREPGFSS